MTIHAPPANLLAPMTSKATPVAAAPSPLSAARGAQPGPRSRHQWTTMPACDRVKARNAPTANRGIRAWVSPPKTTTSSAARPASSRIPLEKTSRSPTARNWRGRKPSRAISETTRGKPV